MTDPTPTRAEVERFSPVDIHERNADMLAETDGQWVRLSDYQALRERAEAAERDRSRLIIANGQLIDDAVSMGMAVDAAWNDAIEAAAVACDGLEMKTNRPSRCARRIRALRRADRPEGEA